MSKFSGNEIIRSVGKWLIGYNGNGLWERRVTQIKMLFKKCSEKSEREDNIRNSDDSRRNKYTDLKATE